MFNEQQVANTWFYYSSLKFKLKQKTRENVPAQNSTTITLYYIHRTLTQSLLADYHSGVEIPLRSLMLLSLHIHGGFNNNIQLMK